MRISDPDGMDATSMRAMMTAKRAAVRDAVDELDAAIGAGDAARTGRAWIATADMGATLSALRKMAQLRDVAPAVRGYFLHSWIENGDLFRSDAGRDLILIDALRAVLPPYRGESLALYRGDSLWNRQRRTYGPSWTTDPDVAREFAQGMYRTFQGGSVVVKTEAPADAIICCVHGTENDRFAEREFVVDRRRLAGVAVIERYGQVALEDVQIAIDPFQLGDWDRQPWSG